MDVYIPLAVAQKLAGLRGDVNTIYVAASSSSAIGTVSSEISRALPGDIVTTSASLANEVTGSLSSASSLANNLGRWLAVAVLISAFLLASLLTMAAVSRRVREFGTLKALGWTSHRIVGQVLGEAVAVGIIGGAVGVGLGLAGAELVTRMSPPLTAVVGPITGSATPGGARQFGFGAFRNADTAAHSVAVHLTASVSPGVIVLAVLLAVAGGIVAGIFGGWRAARLRPADALSKVA